MKRILPAVLLGILVVGLAFGMYVTRQVCATRQECAEALPGDGLITNPLGAVNHAITIHRPPQDVWPWLAQMGAGRGGWYAYDFIDNGGRPSAERILLQYQKIGVGSILPAVPGAKDIFVVAECQTGHSLVLSWRRHDGRYQTTWAFVLDEPRPGETRLLVRGRVASGYRPYGLPEWFAVRAGRVAHFIMERKQLLGIARRAESGGRG